jgi:hypothetical protein
LAFEELGEAWRRRERGVPIEPELTFQDAGLVLGAGAVLAAAAEDGRGRVIRIEGDEARILTLLSIAYWLQAVSPNPSLSRCGLFQVMAGSEFRNFNRFEVGSSFNPPDTSLITYPLFKGALLTMISIWPAPWANAQCSIWREDPPTLPGEPPFPYSGHQMPWISYLDAERAAKVGPLPGVQTERTPDGGLLMIATEDRFDPTSLDHMRPSRLMAQIMIEHGGGPPW